MKRNILRMIVAAAVLTRVYALVATVGITHYDNLYQLLEPAHAAVFGYGLTTWEFVYGMRSWLQPLMIAMVFRLGLIASIVDINQLVFLNRCVMTLFSLVLLCAVYETTLTVYNRKAAAYALFLAAFSGPLWLWSADTSSSIPAAFFTTATILFFYIGWRKKSEVDYFMSGLSLGTAFMFRFDSMLFLVPLALFTLKTGGFRKTEYFAAGLVAMVLLQGILDYFTWGAFMNSPIAFVKHNLLQSKASLFGRQPFYFYVVLFAMHLSCLFLLPYAVERRVGFAFVSLSAGLFVLTYSLIPHKELRFLTPVLPLFFVVAGRGMENAVGRNGRVMLYGVVALTVLQSVFLVYDVGWQEHWGGFQAFNHVGRQSDATGVAYTLRWFESGVYTYLHRRIPAVFIAERTIDPQLRSVKCGVPDTGYVGFQCSPLRAVLAEPRINYIVSGDGNVSSVVLSNGFERVWDYGGVSVYKRGRWYRKVG